MLRRLWRHLHATSCTSTSSGSGHVHENNRGPGLVSTSNAVTNEDTTATVASASPTASSHSGRAASRPSRKRDKEKTTTRTSSDKAKASATQDKASAPSATTGATQQAASPGVSFSATTTTTTTAVTKPFTASPVAEKKIAASDVVSAPPQAKSDVAAPEVHSPAPVTSYENDEDDDGVIGFLDNVIAGNTDQLRKEFAEQKLLSMAQSLPSATKAVPIGPATPTPSSAVAAEAAKASEVASNSNKGVVQTADSALAATKSKGAEAAPANTTVTPPTTKGSTKPSQTTHVITSTNKQATTTAANAPHSGYVSSAARSLQEYELVAYLGSGTFAEVTLARHRRTQELFAIKKTSKQRVREEGCVQRTFTERQLLTSMRHPFLVRLFQAFQSPTHLYYVLEFAQGGDLYYFNESRPWVREAKRSLYKLNYPYYVSSALPTTAVVSNSSRRTYSFGSGALSNNHANKDTQSAAEDNVTASTEAWGWRLSAAQLAHNRSFGACSMLTEDDIEMANVNRSFATRDEASAGGTVRHQRQSAGTHRSGRAGNERRMSRRRQRTANVATDTTRAEVEGTTMADASPPSASTMEEVTPTKLDTTKSGTCGDKDSSPALCESSGVGASPLRRHTTETGVASFTQTAAATTNNTTSAHTPPPCHADSTHATASGEMKTPQTVSIAGLLMQQSSASSDKARTTNNNNTPPSQLRPSASTSVGATSQTPTPRKAVRNDNDNSDDGGDTKEPSRTPITSLTATPRKTKAGDTEHAEVTPSGSRPRRVDVLGARFVERHLEDCTVPLPRPYAEDGTRLPIRIIAFFAIEIALVLQYMHGEGFIYRDLKPENILIKRDGHITLTDFGVAKYRKGAAITPVPSTNNASGSSNAAAGASESTTRQPVIEKESGKSTGKVERTTSFTGTTHYMSPEMLQGLPHDFRTDWWSYGCLLFEWTNGHKAFDNPSQFALFKSIVEEDVKIDAETDFRLTGLELHRHTAQLYRRFQQTASMQAVSLAAAASASRLAASMTADDVRRHDSALLSQRNSGGLDRGRMRSSLTSIDNATVAPGPAEHTTKAELDTSVLPEEKEEEGNDDHESKRPMTSAAHTEPPSCATTPPNNGSFPAMTLQSFAALSFAGSTATPPPPATLSRSRSGSRRLTLPPQLALERLQRRTLTHADRDLLLCHATRQLEEAMGLLRELILALLDRRMERRLCGEAVLAHPFFSCPYVVSQLYCSHAFLAEMLARHAGQRGHTTQQQQQGESNIEGSGVTSPVNHTAVSATDGNEAGSPLLSSDASIITLETFLRDTVYLRRPADWATLFLNLQIRPPYVPRLRAQDDLRYFPSAVTAMGLSVMAEQRKKLKEAHDLQRQQQQEKQQQQQQLTQAREQEKWRHLSFRSNAGGKAWQDIYSFAVPDMAAAVEDEASVEDKVSHHGHRRHHQRRMLQNLSFPDESALRRMRQAREANEALAAVASSRKKNSATVCDDDEGMKRGEEGEGRVASMKPPSAANKAEGSNSVKGNELLPTNSSSAHTRRSHSAEVPSTSTHARTEDAAHEEKEEKGETAAALLPSSGPHRRNKSVTIVYDECNHGKLHSSLASLPDSHRAEDDDEEEDNTTIENTRTTSILPSPPRRVQSAGLPETPTLLAQLPSPSESILTPTRTAVMSRVQSQHELAGLDGKAAGQRRQRRRLVSVREGSLETEKEGTKVAMRPRRDSGHQHHHASHTAHIDTSLMTATNTTVGSSASDEEDDEDDVDIDEDVDAAQRQRGNDVLARAAKLPQDFVAAALAVGAATKNATTTTTTNTPAVVGSSSGGPGAQAEHPESRQDTTAFVGEGIISAVKKEAVTTHTQSSTSASANEGVAAVGAPEATQESAAVKSYYEADALELNEASSGDAAHELQEGSPCVILPEMIMHTAPSVMNATTTTTTTTTTPTTTTTAAVTPSLDNAAWGSTSEAHFTPALPDESGVTNQQATIAVTDKLQPCHPRVISFTPSLPSTVHNVNLMSASGHASATPPPSPQPRIEAAVAAAQQHHLQQTRVEEHEVVGPTAEQTDEVMVTMEEKGTATTSKTITTRAPLLSSHAAGKPPLWEHTTTLTASVHSAPLETRHTNLFTTHSREEDEEEEGSMQESSSSSYNGSGDTVSRRSRSCTSETASMASRSNSATTSRTDSTDSEHSSTATSTSITSSGSDLANLMACSTPFGFGTSPDMTAFMRGNAPRVISVPGTRPNEDALAMPAAQFCPAAAPQPLTRASETDTAATSTTANTALPIPQPTPYSSAEINQAMHYGTDQLAGSDLLTASGPMDEALLSSLQTISRPRQRRNQNLVTGFATLRGIAYNVEDEPYTRYHPQPRNVVSATGEGVRTAFGRNEGPASRPAHHLDPMAQVPGMEAAAAATTVASATEVARGSGNNKGTAFTTMDTRRNNAASPLNLSRTQPDTLLSNALTTTGVTSQATPAAMASSPIGECGVPGLQTRPGQAYRVRPLRSSHAASLVQPAALQLTTGSDSDTTGRLSSATQSPKYVARVNNVVFEEGETTMPRLPQFLSRAVVAHGGSAYNNSSGNEQESSDVGSRSTGSPVQTRPQFALVPTTTIPANNTASCYEGRDSAGVSRTMTPLGIATGAGSGPLTSPLYMTGASRSNNGAGLATSSHAIPVGERTGRNNGSYYDTPPSDFVTGTSYGGFDHFMNFSFAAPFPMSQTLRASIGGGAAGGSSNNNNMSNSNAATVGAAGNVMGPPYCVSATNSVAATAAGANTTVSEVQDT